MLKRIVNRLKTWFARRSSESYCEWLRKKGIHIGIGTYIYPDPLAELI